MKYSKAQYVHTFRQTARVAEFFKEAISENVTSIYPTLERFMAHRDFPLTELECICIFKTVTGKWPTKNQLTVIRPDSYQATLEYRVEQAADYASVYG